MAVTDLVHLTSCSVIKLFDTAWSAMLHKGLNGFMQQLLLCVICLTPHVHDLLVLCVPCISPFSKSSVMRYDVFCNVSKVFNFTPGTVAINLRQEVV